MVLLRFVAAAAFAALPAKLLAKKLERIEALTPVPANEPIPAIDFFRPPRFSQLSLNPAGTGIAALMAAPDDRTNLVVYNSGTKQSRAVGGPGLDVYDYDWLNDERVLFRVGKDRLYAYGLFTAETGKLRRSTALNRYDVVVPIGVPRADPLKPIVWLRNDAHNQGADGGAIQINARHDFDGSKRMHVVHRYPTPKPGITVAYLPDVNGELAHAITVEDGVAMLHRLSGQEWKRCSVDMDRITVLTFGNRPGELLVLAPSSSGKPSAVHLLDTTTGQLGEVLYQDDSYDPVDASVYRHPVDQRILGLGFNRQGPQDVWLDPVYGGLAAGLENALPNSVVKIMGSDRAEKQFFAFERSDQIRGRYYYFDREKLQLALVMDVTPWLDPKRMRPMNVITYKARDGVRIEGYITLPAGASKDQPAPVVVLPHGGPWVRDVWGWNAQVQFLASRGYAVFQPNYRGSDGFGWRVPQEDRWAFRKMHDDVTDGVRAVLQTGFIDPDRIAIMGTSFGGYLALCGAAYEPGLYRCAITVAGIFNWEQVLRNARNNPIAPAQYGLLRRHLGDPKREQERFESISPLHAVDKITIPVFVAHGREDRIASVDESKRLIRALKQHHIPHEVQLEYDEGHGFHFLENQIELYTRVEAFLGKHLRPRPAAKPGNSAVDNPPSAALTTDGALR